MNALHFATLAVTSALGCLPLQYPTNYQPEFVKVLAQQEEITEQAIATMSEHIFVAERMLTAFYQLAEQRLTIFDEFEEGELFSLLKESAKLLFSTKRYADDNATLLQNLNAFEQRLNQLTRLLKSVEYKKELDSIVLERSHENEKEDGLCFDGSLSLDEKRAKLIAFRRG